MSPGRARWPNSSRDDVEIARVDPDYLQWLRNAHGYRWFSADMDDALASIRVGVPRL